MTAIFLPFIPHAIPEQVNMRFENRTDIWTTSYLAGFDHPIIGTGFGSMETVINKKAWETTNFIRFQSVDNGHNLFLNWWIMGGSLGLSLFIILMLISVTNLYKTKSWAFLSILIGLLIIQLFNPVSSVILVQFWWVLGISFSKKQY